MNHLCKDSCEFCGMEILQTYEPQDSETVFSILLVGSRGKVPYVLDYGFQRDFACSVCFTCATSLLVTDKTTYKWKYCHCCGTDTSKDISAFRMAELEIECVEEHLYDGKPVNVISASTTEQKGPIGYTICTQCVVAELATSDETTMKDLILEAVEEGDVYEEIEAEL